MTLSRIDNTSGFVIVIEADNKRVKAAFDKGLVDFDNIWPQIQEYCKRKYDKDYLKYSIEKGIEQKKIDGFNEYKEKLMAPYMSEMEAYNKKLKNHQMQMEIHLAKSQEYNSKSWWNKTFSGPPESPIEPSHPKVPRLDLEVSRPYPMLIHSPTSKEGYYQSIRAQIKRMRDLADASLGPFRMTENHVERMVSLEDGSYIEGLLEEIQEELRMEAPQIPILE